LAGSYYYLPPLALWLRAIIVISVVMLLGRQYGTFFSGSFFINALVAFFWLKIIELYTLRDLRVIILCTFYVIFTALVLQIKLWIFIYMILALMADVSLLLKLELPTVNFKTIFAPTLRFLLIAVPISLLMFFLFPRFSEPLWRVNLSAPALTGFNEKMTPGSVAELFQDDSTVMRVIFNSSILLNSYWHGLVLNYYDGLSWTSEPPLDSPLLPLPPLPDKQAADYEILLEPHQKTWLFYQGNPVGGWPNLQFSASSGLMRLDGKVIQQRFAYGLKIQAAPYQALSKLAFKQNLQLPAAANPRLRAWALVEKNKAPDNKALVANIMHYIQQQPFWYRLAPADIGRDNQQLDRFWFATREGYCEHYASAVTFILRAAGIPARVILGYQGGEWNPLARYLNIRQKDAHAWVEYWNEGIGWQRVDPTSFIDRRRIDQAIIEQSQLHNVDISEWDQYRLNMSLLERMRLSFDSAHYFIERWLMFYNQERQQGLLQALGIGPWQWQRLLQAWVGSLLLMLVLGALWYALRQKLPRDPLLAAYQQVQQELSRLHVKTTPPATLAQQCAELANKQPQLATVLHQSLAQYEDLRLRPKDSNHPRNRKATLSLFKKLSKLLRTR